MVGGDRLFFREVRKILRENPDGILKNQLIRIMTERGISSRNTIYAKFPEMTGPKGRKIIRIEKRGKRELCFPSELTDNIEKFFDKIRIEREFLRVLEQEDELGDHLTVFVSNDKQKRHFFVNSRKVLEKRFRKPRGFVYKSSFSPYSKYFLLKEFPFFIFEQIKSASPPLPKSISKELLEELAEITNHVFKILQKDYAKTGNYAMKAGLKAFSKHWTDGEKTDAGIATMKMFFPLEIKNRKKLYVEKLTEILFMLHLKYGKDECWNSSQEKCVTDLMEKFFSKKDVPENFDIMQKTILK